MVGAGLVAAPFVSEPYASALGDGAFALVMLGALAAIAAVVTAFLFRSRHRHRRSLVAGRGLLAHWRYSDSEWRAFAGDERTRQADEKRGLLKVTGIIMVVVAVPFVVLDHEAGPWVALVLGATWLLCWIAARLTLRSQAVSRGGPVPEARIGRDALLLGDELHVWRGWDNALESCSVDPGPPPMLAITYSSPGGRKSRNEITVRVPIPQNREAEAADVSRRIAATAT